MIDKKQFLDTYNMTEQDIIDAKIRRAVSGIRKRFSGFLSI